MFEDNAPVAKPEQSIESMSVDELHERIRQLQDEIRLCEAELERKKSHLESVQGLFGD